MGRSWQVTPLHTVMSGGVRASAEWGEGHSGSAALATSHPRAKQLTPFHVSLIASSLCVVPSEHTRHAILLRAPATCRCAQPRAQSMRAFKKPLEGVFLPKPSPHLWEPSPKPGPQNRAVTGSRLARLSRAALSLYDHLTAHRPPLGDMMRPAQIPARGPANTSWRS